MEIIKICGMCLAAAGRPTDRPRQLLPRLTVGHIIFLADGASERHELRSGISREASVRQTSCSQLALPNDKITYISLGRPFCVRYSVQWIF